MTPRSPTFRREPNREVEYHFADFFLDVQSQTHWRRIPLLSKLSGHDRINDRLSTTRWSRLVSPPVANLAGAVATHRLVPMLAGRSVPFAALVQTLRFAATEMAEPRSQ